MKINQVEELTGITRKNIRFYEEQGLVSPERNPANGYREYDLQNVDTLLRIRLLRKLDVPIEEIRRMQRGEITFDACMENQQIRLNHAQQNLEHMREMCMRLSEEVDDWKDVQVQDYLEKMKRLEEGGTVFVDVEHRDVRKKQYGAALAAAGSIIFMVLMIGLILWANAYDPMPTGLFVGFLLVLAALIVCIIAVWYMRYKEIKGGEEDEARKY